MLSADFKTEVPGFSPQFPEYKNDRKEDLELCVQQTHKELYMADHIA